MNLLLAIGAGGALGSIARYLMSVTLQRWVGPSFPVGTVIINVLGSFVIGLVYVWCVERTGSSNTLRLFLMVGVLGGFTTFSSFSLETVTLMMGSNYGYALLNVALSVLLCVAGTRLGMTLARL